MAEETKTTSTRGRKPKAKVEETKTEVKDSTDIELESKDNNDMIAKLMAQMAELQKQVEDSKKEKTDLETLVDALKSNTNQSSSNNLPKKVKIVSLIPNTYSLTTEPNGQGTQYVFEDIGNLITMNTSDLEKILSIPMYRKQAEKGMFYILDKDIIEDQGLTEAYENICDEDMLLRVMNLTDDSCVDVFCGLSKDMQDSLATKMAESINNGKRLDRNRLADISMRTDIDIEEMAKTLKKTLRKPKDEE